MLCETVNTTSGKMYQVRDDASYGVLHWKHDAGLPQFKLPDDKLEAVGNAIFPKQATSLYLLL